MVGGVAGEHAVADRQRPEVVDAAAVAGAGIAPGDRQAREAHRLAGFDLEDSGDIVAANGQRVGAGAVDRQVVRDVELAAGQGDRAGQPRLEDDDVGAGEGVGLGDGGAERAGAPVGQRGDVEGRQDQAALQLLQGQASMGRALAGPPRGAGMDLG